MKTLTIDDVPAYKLPREWRDEAFLRQEDMICVTIRPDRSDSVRRALAVLDDLQRDAVMNGIEDLSDEEFDALIND